MVALFVWMGLSLALIAVVCMGREIPDRAALNGVLTVIWASYAYLEVFLFKPHHLAGTGLQPPVAPRTAQRDRTR